MSWHFLERWIEKANQHSTLIGKFWITFLIVCRMVIVASVGDRVYNDEQSEFKCNTLQPGCTNVCFNSFSPISHLRFWSFQILFVATPSVMFVVYSAHKSKMKKAASKKNRPSNDEEDDGSEKQFSGLKRGRMNNLANLSGMTKSPNNCYDMKNKPSLETRDSKKRKAHKNHRGKKYDIELHQNKLHDEGDSFQYSIKDDPGDTYHRRLTGDYAYPISTLIKLPTAEQRGGHQADNYKQKNSHSKYDDRRSSTNTSGFGTIEHRGKNAPNKNTNFCNNNNSNNNTETANVFVWREPTCTSANTHARATSPKVSTATGEPDNHDNSRARNDVVVWYPSGQGNGNPNLPRISSEVMSSGEKSSKQAQNKQDQMEGANDYTTRAVPTAPPEYPGTNINCDPRPWLSPSKVSVDQVLFNETMKLVGKSDPNCYDDQLKIMKQKASISKLKAQLPSFAQHFRWYVASVFLRLCMEFGFVFLQLVLFGLSVPELYKCNRWPCPNQVDCFISRPMEKTIFLWFMFIYSCICVVLNFAEFVYLIYASITKYSSKRLTKEMLDCSTDRSKKTLWYRDDRTRMQLKDGTWVAVGGLHPVEMDLEIDRDCLQSGTSFQSRYDGFGHRLRGGKSDAKRKQASVDTVGHGGQFSSGRENFNRDYMTFVLDSEEEREELEIELDRQEQADMNDYNDLAGNDPNLDNNGDDAGGDGGI